MSSSDTPRGQVYIPALSDPAPTDPDLVASFEVVDDGRSTIGNFTFRRDRWSVLVIEYGYEDEQWVCHWVQGDVRDPDVARTRQFARQMLTYWGVPHPPRRFLP